MRGFRAGLMVTGIAWLALASTASAHETQTAGAVRLTIGWSDEPAFTGIRNAVEVVVTDANGAPVTDAAASLRVEVSFGTELVVLALPPGGQPGRFSAALVPTQPGTYTFHVTGTVRGETVDTTSTCSDRTFDCVTDVASAQFPTKEPAGGLAERLERESRRVKEAQQAASDARRLSVGALVLAASALATTLVLGRRRSRRGG